jgi:hypothetical protein
MCTTKGVTVRPEMICAVFRGYAKRKAIYMPRQCARIESNLSELQGLYHQLRLDAAVTIQRWWIRHKAREHAKYKDIGQEVLKFYVKDRNKTKQAARNHTIAFGTGLLSQAGKDQRRATTRTVKRGSQLVAQ